MHFIFCKIKIPQKWRNRKRISLISHKGESDFVYLYFIHKKKMYEKVKDVELKTQSDKGRVANSQFCDFIMFVDVN